MGNLEKGAQLHLQGLLVLRMLPTIPILNLRALFQPLVRTTVLGLLLYSLLCPFILV